MYIFCPDLSLPFFKKYQYNHWCFRFIVVHHSNQARCQLKSFSKNIREEQPFTFYLCSEGVHPNPLNPNPPLPDTGLLEFASLQVSYGF